MGLGRKKARPFTSCLLGAQVCELLELGGTECPTGPITLHEGGVIVVLLCPASVVHGH